jgi:hypothetical protein
MPAKLALEITQLDPLVVVHFPRVRAGRPLEDAEEDVFVFVLGEATPRVVHTVDKREDLAQRRVEAQLLAQAAVGGLVQRLTRPRVATAGVGPEAFEMVLLARAELQGHSPAGVANQDREGPVQLAAVAVRAELLLSRDDPVLLVHQEDLFHRSPRPRSPDG